MFELVHLFDKTLTGIKVTYNNKPPITFTIGSVISKRNKADLDIDKQFLLLNSYLDYKGEDFKEELYSRLSSSYDEISAYITNDEIHPLPYQIVHPVLNLFDIMDVFNYIKNIYRIKPPINLADEFNPLIESDGRGTRVQTYLKDDFLELSALALIIKVALGPICHFAYIKEAYLNSMHTEYILFHFFIPHPIFTSPPMVKLYGLCDKLVNLPTAGADADAIRVLEKQLPKSEMPLYMLGVVVVQKISIATIIDDNEQKNIITKIYNYINNRLKSSGDVSNSIRNKTALSDPDGANGSEKESMVESYRIMTDLTKGTVVEINHVVSDIFHPQYGILKQLHPNMLMYIDSAVLAEAIQFTKAFANSNIHKVQLDILGFVFKRRILDPRAMDHLEIDNIINLVAIMFAYLWGMGMEKLAVLLTAQIDHMTTEVVTINSTVNRSRIPKEYKDELSNLFPYERVINDTTTANLVEEYINEAANEIFDVRWIPTAYSHYVEKATGEKGSYRLLPPDLKILLCEFIIKHERLLCTDNPQALTE